MLNDVNGGSSVDDVELLRQRVQQYPTRFAWVDGKIERVCQEEDEHVMSVNIKRGILSSLQNSMTTNKNVSRVSSTASASNNVLSNKSNLPPAGKPFLNQSPSHQNHPGHNK